MLGYSYNAAELVEIVKQKHGITISTRTLLRYEKSGLIPPAMRGGHGRGKGRFTYYPEGTEISVVMGYIKLNKSNVIANVLERDFPDVHKRILKIVSREVAANANI